MLHELHVVPNNLASHEFILDDMISYCVPSNRTASCNFKLCLKILFCVLWFQMVWYDSMLVPLKSQNAISWNHIAQCEIRRPIMISCCTLWSSIKFILNKVHKVQYYYTDPHIKSYCAIWKHKTQYWIVRSTTTSRDTILNHKRENCFTGGNIKSYLLTYFFQYFFIEII